MDLISLFVWFDVGMVAVTWLLTKVPRKGEER
jgi:hypothetical protein